MPRESQPRQQLLLRGEQHATFGQCDVATVTGGRTAAAITVGGDYVWRWKGHQTSPNEDCALAIDDADRTLLVICDGHHGPRASHALIDAFATVMQTREVPSDAASLARLVHDAVLAAGATESAAITADEVDSASTMTAVVLDRARQCLFGLCSGDSSAVVVPAQGRPVVCSEKGDDYLVPWRRQSFVDWPPRPFAAPVRPDDLVVLFSDGIDECHRHRPETSIGLRHLEQLRQRHADVTAFAVALVELALAGVDGNAGGEDNAAVLVTRC